MDWALIQTFISSIGFPIACVVWLFYSQEKEREIHREEVANLTEAIQNNTVVMTELKEMIRNGGK